MNLRKLLKPGVIGEAELSYFEISPSMDIKQREDIPCGEYVRLKIGGKVIMSNTPMEYETNREFIENAYGDVFVAGLGMGMILMEIQDNPDVKSITVLERRQDVIQLISDQLPLSPKVKIRKGDVFNYWTATTYDYIYFDIWDAIAMEYYMHDFPTLRNKFQHNLKPVGRPYPRMRFWGETTGDEELAQVLKNVAKLRALKSKEC